jgi:uncharacterized membrane protein YhiD involved in acid resistance
VLQLNFGSTKIETETLFAILEKYAIKTISMNIQQSKDKKKTRMKLIISLPQRTELRRLYKDLNGIDNITQIRLG